MSDRHSSAGVYENEVNQNPEKLTAPHDGAVFWTNGWVDKNGQGPDARRKALDHCAAETEAGRPCATLEGRPEDGKYGTELGHKYDRQDLYNNRIPEVAALNRKERHGAHANQATPGARKVFDHTSKSYAQNASGRVEVFTGGAPIKDDSTFARCERDALIRNEKVTEINGVPREDLKRTLDDPKLTKEEKNGAINARIEQGCATRDQRLAARKDQAKPQSAFDRHMQAKQDRANASMNRHHNRNKDEKRLEKSGPRKTR